MNRDDLNVVWVVMDAASARHLGPWGAADDTSPHLDIIANESVVFARAYSQWPATLGSVSSYLTGRYPDPKIPPRKLQERGIATRLREAGWQTVGFSENPFVDAAHGFERELGELHATEPLRKERGWLDHARRDSRASVECSLKWIDAHGSARFFLYLHLLPPHAPYNAPPPFSGRFSSEGYTGSLTGSTRMLEGVNRGELYASDSDLVHLRQLYHDNIAYVDSQIGRLYSGLATRDLLERTILVIASDHGEAFGEHGLLTHGNSLYEEELHVPLLIRFPERFETTHLRWEGVVELVDLVPTLLEALDQPAQREGAGESLLPILAGQPPSEEIARAWVTQRAGRFATAIGRRYKLIANPSTGSRELYDLERDPAELADLSQREAQVAGRFEKLLLHGSRPLRSESVELNSETKNKLEALGYFED